MFDEKKQAVVRKGRPKGSRNRRNAEILELAQRLNADPVDFMLLLVSSTTVEVAQTDVHGNVLLDANNQPLRKLVAVPLEMKLDACKSVAPYLYARLSSQQITGQVDVFVRAEFPIDKILADRALTAALSELAMLVASDEANALKEAPQWMQDAAIGD